MSMRPALHEEAEAGCNKAEAANFGREATSGSTTEDPCSLTIPGTTLATLYINFCRTRTYNLRPG